MLSTSSDKRILYFREVVEVVQSVTWDLAFYLVRGDSLIHKTQTIQCQGFIDEFDMLRSPCHERRQTAGKITEPAIR